VNSPEKPHSFPASGFDDWSREYDQSVMTDEFPFTGYQQILTGIVSQADPRPGDSILDLGTGSGNLAILFSQLGCSLWCTDFSFRMLAKARLKLPSACFIQHDLKSPMPFIDSQKFSHVVSAYTLHHFPLDEKITIISLIMSNHLAEGGKFIIGDITFRDMNEKDKMHSHLAEAWEEEYYWLRDETLKTFRKIGVKSKYQYISNCAGIFTFLKE
jgi:ubiquinone/menaquinone biosynthesis C-methylase UbiE